MDHKYENSMDYRYKDGCPECECCPDCGFCKTCGDCECEEEHEDNRLRKD